MMTFPREPAESARAPRDAAEFRVDEGGMLYEILRRARLTDDALGHLVRRVIVITLVAWLPLLALSAVDGHLLGGGVVVPFLLDIETHVRLLVALPLLIVAEVETFRRAPPIFRQFRQRRLVPDDALPRFQAILASTLRLRNSVLAEILILAAVFAIGIYVWRHFVGLDAATWYATPSTGGPVPTRAGIWYAYVSLPIVQFVTFRWYYRLFLWARLHLKISRITLRLAPLHPDRAGGLGFLGSMGYALTLFAVAHGATTAGFIAGRIFFAGARLTEFADQVALVVVLMVCVIFGPLVAYAPQLLAAKMTGLRTYGELGERYVRTFDDKWLAGRAPEDEALIGSADIQSLADLANSYEVVRTMRIVPTSVDAILRLVIATLIPVIPLALTMIPLNELVKRVFGLPF